MGLMAQPSADQKTKKNVSIQHVQRDDFNLHHQRIDERNQLLLNHESNCYTARPIHDAIVIIPSQYHIDLAYSLGSSQALPESRAG
jgi:hypothetical protein